MELHVGPFIFLVLHCSVVCELLKMIKQLNFLPIPIHVYRMLF